MSYYQQRICYKILNEYFGAIVAKVGEILFKHGVNPLHHIRAKSNLSLSKIREALAVLIQHNLVNWSEWRPNIAGYTLMHERVLLILRFPRYVYLVREQFGEESEMVVDVLLKEGQATASHIIVTSCLKLHEATDDVSTTSTFEERHITVRNHFLRLLEAQFIQRCPSPNNPLGAVPVMAVKEEELYSCPVELLDLKMLQQEVQQGRAGTLKSSVIHPDANVLWRLNYDRFHLEFRDSDIRNSIVRRVDPLAGECLGAILKVAYIRSDPWAPTLNVVTSAEIRDQLKDLKYLDQYLKVLEEESGGCLQRVGDAGGGEYKVNLAAAYTTLTNTLIDNIIQDRFGSKASRIFRLIRDHHMMEQDQIGELSMINKKEANLLSYKLLHDNFLRLHELRKSLIPSSSNKNIYLFHVEMNSVVRMILEWCYRALYNLMVQRDMRHGDNRRLLEKKARVDSIVENLKTSGATPEQIQEVEEMVTPAEKELAELVLATQDKLFDSETGIDETIFILQMFLYYQQQK